MKKSLFFLSLGLFSALLLTACGIHDDTVRPGETISASAASGSTLQKDGSRWSITSLADWDEFDYDGNFSDNCHAFLRGMLEGESNFTEFQTLRISEYRLTRDEKEYGLPCLYFEFTVTVSEIEALPVGSHTAILTDAVDCFLTLNDATKKDKNSFADVDSAKAVRSWIDSSLNWEMPAFGTANTEDALAYLLAAYGEDGKLPFDMLCAYADEKLGIRLSAVDAKGMLDVLNGRLFVIASNALPNMLYNYSITAVDEIADGAEVTVQFYADCNSFFKSHTVVYTIGSGGILRGCHVKELSPYSPYGLQS